MPKLILNRVDQLLGGARAFKVYCDGHLLGRLPTFGQFAFDIKAGKHEIEIKMWPNTSEKQIVDLLNEADEAEFYTGFAAENILESTGYNSLKLLPEKAFFRIHNQEAESKFKERVQHHHWVAIPGLIVSSSIMFLTFQQSELFSGEAGMSFVLALAMGIGAVQLSKRSWILSKSFCINKPAYDAAIILFIFLGYVEIMPLKIAALILSTPFLVLWFFMRRKYALNQDKNIANT